MSSNNIQTPISPAAPRNLKIKVLVIVVAAAVLVTVGILSRANNQKALVQLSQQQELPIVKVIRPVAGTTMPELVLPGTLQPFYSAAVYARVSGYLKKWRTDIGTPVRAGEEMASIETPELDQQLKQSQANLVIAQANLRLTEITSKRWQNLLKTDSVSKQETDEKNGDFEAKQAVVVAARADVDRLLALESFKKITAPFDGIVTARKTDIGALINAGHDAGHELFTVDDVHILRLFVEVPQSYAQQFTPGMKAQLDIPSLPGQLFNAVLTASSHAVNSATGTMKIELQVDNSAHKLLPGGYGNVHFQLAQSTSQVEVPATALVFRKEGMSVAVLSADNHVQFRSIQIGHDLGAAVEVVAGLTAGDRVVDAPPDSLEQNDQVRVAEGNVK